MDIPNETHFFVTALNQATKDLPVSQKCGPTPPAQTEWIGGDGPHGR
jgi:hypothetical protein